LTSSFPIPDASAVQSSPPAVSADSTNSGERSFARSPANSAAVSVAATVPPSQAAARHQTQVSASRSFVPSSVPAGTPAKKHQNRVLVVLALRSQTCSVVCSPRPAAGSARFDPSGSSPAAARFPAASSPSPRLAFPAAARFPASTRTRLAPRLDPNPRSGAAAFAFPAVVAVAPPPPRPRRRSPRCGAGVIASFVGAIRQTSRVRAHAGV
jgi:hypothetical protein